MSEEMAEKIERIADEFRGSQSVLLDVMGECGVDASQLNEVQSALLDYGVEACAVCGTWGESDEMNEDEHGAPVCWACEDEVSLEDDEEEED